MSQMVLKTRKRSGLFWHPIWICRFVRHLCSLYDHAAEVTLTCMGWVLYHSLLKGIGSPPIWARAMAPSVRLFCCGPRRRVWKSADQGGDFEAFAVFRALFVEKMILRRGVNSRWKPAAKAICNCRRELPRPLAPFRIEIFQNKGLGHIQSAIEIDGATNDSKTSASRLDGTDE